MKRSLSILFAAVFIIAAGMSAFVFSSCSGSSYTVVYYEDETRRNRELSFDMADVPEPDGVELEAVGLGAMDGKLGETVYAVKKADDGEAELTLTFRMAELGYAEKLAKNDGAPGISGITSGKEAGTERIGSCTVAYYTDGNTVFAVWDDGKFSYSAAVSLPEGSDAATDDVREYVIAVIATPGGRS